MGGVEGQGEGQRGSGIASSMINSMAAWRHVM